MTHNLMHLHLGGSETGCGLDTGPDTPATSDGGDVTCPDCRRRHPDETGGEIRWSAPLPRTTRDERHALSTAVGRLRAAGCRVGHVIGHDLATARLHYSVTLPGDDTAAGALRVRIGHGRTFTQPGIAVWADPHERGRLTFRSRDPELTAATLAHLADVIGHLTAPPSPPPVVPLVLAEVNTGRYVFTAVGESAVHCHRILLAAYAEHVR